MKPAFVALAVASLLVRTAAVVACGATAPPFYVVEAQSPADDAAPVNTPILVKVQEGQAGPAVEGFAPTLTLTVQGDDQALELLALGSAPTLTWVPVLSLEPNTSYEAHYNPGYEGIPDTIWQFATGASAAPALEVVGELSVTLEAGMDVIQDCPSPCGGDCVESGQIAVTKARVKLPRVQGGFAARWATVWLTTTNPTTFRPKRRAVRTTWSPCKAMPRSTTLNQASFRSRCPTRRSRTFRASRSA